MSNSFSDAIMAYNNATSALASYAALKSLIDMLSEYLEQWKPDAIAQAEELLAADGKSSGQFTFDNHVFSLDRKEVFDFVGRPQRYTLPAGVQYRTLAREQDELKKLSTAKTKQMKALSDAFRIEHPDFTPDKVTRTLKLVRL